MEIATTFAAARSAVHGTTVVVPTMGSLHAGHLSLVERARRLGDSVVVTVFVNPLQFDDAGDLARYPRSLDRDAELAARAGADVVFAPDDEEMYPVPPLTRVVVGGVTDRMEGAHRPGHFEGVATVVTKLLAGLRPDVAVFGRKDAQQLAVVRVLVRDLSLPVEIVAGSTVRDPDGLALSSRNAGLEPSDRAAAVAISRGLFAAADLVEAGERDALVLEKLVESTLAEAGIRPDYTELADQATAERLTVLAQPAFLAVAARVGGVRLIDNVAFDEEQHRFTADRGIALADDGHGGAG
jgi:pantoate--beta-alanine ligase